VDDAFHPSGTTRMSVNERSGVVDRDLAVHGTPNLFVCGSSVFPTAGYANPTQTICALALRLADRLRLSPPLLK
jgi:choline dehydrogenase-like flavoprotein